MVNITKIETLIKEKGWSNTYFCAQMGHSKVWIADMRRGRGLPDENALRAIADKLGTTVEYLTDKSEQKNKPAAKSDELDEALKPLRDITRDFTAEERVALVEYAEFLRSKHKKSNQE